MNRYKFCFNIKNGPSRLMYEIKGNTYKEAVSMFKHQMVNAEIVEVWVLCGED